MESHNGLGKLLPKSLTARRKQKTKRSKADETTDRPLSSSGSRSIYGNDNDEDREFTDEADDRSFASYDSSADAGRSVEDLQRSSSLPRPVRPQPSNHPSLVNYLTTSSPAVQAAHLDSPPKIRSSSRTSRSVWRRPNKNEKTDHPEPASSVMLPDVPVPAKLAAHERDTRGQAPKLDVEAPRTPPNGDRPGPAIVNTPPTPTDFGLGIKSSLPSSDKRASFAGKIPAETGSPTRNMSIHRRSKSGGAAIGPSKLSSITSVPLTPSSEAEGSATTPSAASFFSSVISAAQSAATTLSNNMPGTGIGIGNQKNKATSSKSASLEALDQPEDDISMSSQHNPEETTPQPTRLDQRSSAIQTLGTGELSLSQLGLSDAPSNVASPASARFPDIVDTRARSESAPVEPHSDLPSDEPVSRPRSVIESVNGDEFMEDVGDPKFSVNRSSSVRSALKPHRKRGSSVTTGATIGLPGAPLQSTPTLGAPKLTGFAIASKKRNRDFHSFFKSVPDDDYLIEDYSCALQREILAHGRLYVSEGHLCFSSNILGWTTTLVMSFDEIVSVEKRSTALVFKNGLMISTLHAKHVFASFTSRDATYDLIVNIWKLGHPTLKSSLNGVQLEGTGGDKTEKVDDNAQGLGLENDTPVGSESEDGSEDDDDDFYDEEEHGDFVDTQLTEVSGGADLDNEKAVSRKVSTMTALNGASGDGTKDAPNSPPLGTDFPGPATHAPTDISEGSTQYDKNVGDDIIPAPLGKVYNLLFGSGSAAWMTKWLSEDQKCLEVQVDEKKGLTMDNTTRTWTYIKPLYAALGPKQTKCIVTETLESLDYEKSITLVLSTRTPEVPSGTLFTVKTSYCFTWAENNATRLQVSYTTEWTGKSWIKGPIEKNVNDGQAQFCKELFVSAKAAVTSRGRSGTLTNGGKGKKKGKKGRASLAANEASNVANKKSDTHKAHWGPLEPIRGILEPILDILKPVLTGNVMYGLLVGLLVASWFGFGFSPSKPAGGFGAGGSGRGEMLDLYGPLRIAAYEEMWRREESELWDWLEERTGLGQMDSDSHGIRKRAVEPRTVQERMREARMDAREIQEAIRVTEEKLKILRQVIDNNGKKEKGNEAAQ